MQNTRQKGSSPVTSFLFPRPDAVQNTEVVRRISNLMQHINPHGRNTQTPEIIRTGGRVPKNTYYAFRGYQQPAFAEGAATAYIPPHYRIQPEPPKRRHYTRGGNDWQLTQYIGTTDDFIRTIATKEKTAKTHKSRY